MSDKQQHLDHLRHSAAHLLGAAVLELWPEAKLTIGPAIENGFYYDIDADHKFSEEDFPQIEAKMRELLKNWESFTREEVSFEEAKKRYIHNPYKTELIEQFSEEGQTLSFYKAGEFSDLCRGGHVEKPSQQLQHFKLLSVAGAYWRGDEKNTMLSRIYGTIFPSKKELNAYLNQLEEAKQRDHKKLGKQFDLFTFSDLVGPGLPLWTPRGTAIRQVLDEYLWELRKAKGFDRVEIPHVTKKDLYETSGHWDKFADELFRITTREGHELAMKPMNCPHHTQIFARKQHSYREMPQRFSTTTMVYRDEQTGELNGLSRVRSITQDDSHVFCRSNQIKQEVQALWDIVDDFYAPHGIEIYVRLSLHDPEEPEKYLGGEEVWKDAEQQLREAAKERGIEVTEITGEAAFYGPKLDFMGRDSLGREWQLSTIQLDFNMPERFDLFCINEAGEKERIVMLHSAIMGSIERFMAIVIEHYAGAFPAWLAPEQVRVVPIADAHLGYAETVREAFVAQGIRTTIDDRSERLSAKIRLAEVEKVPFTIVIGDNEEKDKMVALRARGADKKQLLLGLDEAVEMIGAVITEKTR